MPLVSHSAVILAGQRPGVDRLAAAFGIRWKALVEVDGEPMLSRVARVLVRDPLMARIVVLAQEPDALLDHPGTRWMRNEPRIVTSVSKTASICQSMIDMLEDRPDSYPWLVTTADNPLLDSAMINDFRSAASAAQLAAAVVERRTLLAAYPNSRRTWLRFRGGAYSGANLFWLGSAAASRGLEAWRRIEQDRKRARAVLGAFGWVLPALAALRLLTLGGAARRVGRRLGLPTAVVVLRQPEACIDVDKPEDHALAEHILRNRRLDPI